MIGSEQLPRAAEPGGDLVEDQQHLVSQRDLAQHVQVAGVVETHPAGTLHDRFNDHCGQLVSVLGHGVSELLHVGVVQVHRWWWDEHLPGQDVCPHRVHPAVGIAHAHCPEGVTVIATAPGEHSALAGAAQRTPVLQGHLDRHLHRHRAGVGEEHVAQWSWSDLHQAAGQPDRGLVGQPSEHHVAHPRELVARRGIEHRVGVAVNRRPPRRHAIHQLFPVGELEPDP